MKKMNLWTGERMTEQTLVNRFVASLSPGADFIRTEIPNFNRSADIAIKQKNGEVWIIECKLSAVGKAIKQLHTHKLSADRVYIGLPKGRRTQTSIDKISMNGFGLLEIDDLGVITETIEAPHNDFPTEHFKQVLENNMRTIYP